MHARPKARRKPPGDGLEAQVLPLPDDPCQAVAFLRGMTLVPDMPHDVSVDPLPGDGLRLHTSPDDQVTMAGKNIGDLLNEAGLTWGSFMGGFDLTLRNADSSTGCDRQSPATAANGGPTRDYIPHHAWFQYYASTANPTHARPSSIAARSSLISCW